MQPDAAALAGHGAEQVLQHLGAAGAVQTGDAQDLALAQLEGGVLQAGVFARDVLHVQNHLAGGVGLFGEAVGQFAAHHQADDLVHRQLFGRAGGHPGAVAHDGDLVADAQNLLHLVRDVDDAAPLFAQHVDDAEQVLHLRLGERGGGLVEHDDLGIVGHRLCDLHQLPLGHRQGGHHRFGIHLHLQGVEDAPGFHRHLLFVHHHARHLGVAAQPQVVFHRAGECLVQLLVHHGHAVFQRLLGASEVDLPAVEHDGALVAVVDAEQAFHQGGFARTVLPHQGVHGAGPDREIHFIQRFYAGKGFADAAHFQQDRLLHIHSPLLLCIFRHRAQRPLSAARRGCQSGSPGACAG